MRGETCEKRKDTAMLHLSVPVTSYSDSDAWLDEDLSGRAAGPGCGLVLLPRGSRREYVLDAAVESRYGSQSSFYRSYPCPLGLFRRDRRAGMAEPGSLLQK